MTEAVMSETQACEVLSSLSSAGIRGWVMGGWGVDALLGDQTRAHHDLDLLVDAQDLPALDTWLRAEAFDRSHAWSENSPVTIEGHTWDTAYVERHADGRELDVHAIHVTDGSVRLATTDPWELPPDILSGVGRIGGHEVRCASVRGQRAMHVGHALPDKHLEDLRLLEAFDPVRVSEPGCLIVVSGLPGSGKTTRAKELEAGRPGVRFCPDEWITALGASLWDNELRARVESLQWATALGVLRAGGTAIIEWGTWGRDERERLRAGAEAVGARTELLFLDAPIDVLWARIVQRGAEDPPITRSDLVAWHDFVQGQRPDEAERRAFDAVL